MEHATAGSSFAALAYLIAGVCFILALRGLSSPSTSRTGNRFGIIGMAVAVVTTLVTHDVANIFEILIAIAIGAVIGLITARRIAMTAMPELVAAFHSLVGLAAVLVGWAAYLNPGAFGLLTDTGIGAVSKVEMGLGIAIGAITFSGSVIAFAVVTETVFAWPGIGRLMFEAINQRDYAVILGVFYISGAMVLLFNLITDVVYVIVDPRIKLTR